MSYHISSKFKKFPCRWRREWYVLKHFVYIPQQTLKNRNIQALTNISCINWNFLGKNSVVYLKILSKVRAMSSFQKEHAAVKH